MALTLARPVTSSSSHLSTHSLLLHRRLISFTSITQPPSVPSLILDRRSVAATGFTAIRCKWVKPWDSNSTREKDKANIQRLQNVKLRSRKSYNEIAEQTGLTNVYVAQLLRRQAELKPDATVKLQKELPDLSNDLLNEMTKPPTTHDDPEKLIQDPVDRLSGAVLHFGESIKEIINEEFGGGMTSAIDFCSVDKVKGVDGKDRVPVTFMWP